MEEKKKLSYNIIGGVLFGLLALINLVSLFRYITYSFSFTTCLEFICFGATAFVLFTKKNKTIIIIAMSILTIISLFGLVNSIIDEVQRDSDLSILFYLFYYISKLAIVLAYVISGLISIDKFNEKLKKYCFIPMICFVFYIIIDVLLNMYYGYFHLQYKYILTAAAFLYLNMWFAYPDGLPKKFNGFLYVFIIVSVVAILLLFFVCNNSRDKFDDMMSRYDFGDNHYYDSHDNQIKENLWSLLD